MTRFTDERRDFQREQDEALAEMVERAEDIGFVYAEMGGDITGLCWGTLDEPHIVIQGQDYDGAPEDINDPVVVSYFADGEDTGTHFHCANIGDALEFVIGQRLD